MAQGSFGEIKVFEDFIAHAMEDIDTGAAWTETGVTRAGALAFASVNEGSIAWTVDEPGGVLAITTDTADNDNAALLVGKFKPADGGMQMECRFKVGDVAATQLAVFAGFTETLALDTPVMPAERATATTTYNGTGGMLGALFDSDSTILRFFGVAGDGGAALATKDRLGAVGSANGVDAGNTMTADRWYIVRVEMGPDGKGRVYLGDIDGGDELQLVCETTAAVGTSDLFYAVLMIENRAGGAEVLEVDYFYARGWRDWSAS